MLAMLALVIGRFGAGGLLATLRGHRGWFSLIIPFYLFSQINFFTGHILNALFLNAFGTTGSAVIVHSQETNSQLNDLYVWDYDAILKTADGRDLVIQFNTMSAGIYPIRNQILIPPENEPFVAKYIPSFECNIVVMSDESAYGKRIVIDQNRAPVEGRRSICG